MRLNRLSTRLERVGFASEKSSRTPRSVGVIKRYREPVETRLSSMSLVTVRRASSTSTADASDRSSPFTVTPSVDAIWLNV